MRISDWSSTCALPIFDRREAVWTPRNPKATDSLWKSNLKVMDERAAKRQKIEEKTDLLPPRRSFQPLGYASEKEKQKYDGTTILEAKRSEELRVGKECVSTVGSRWSRYNKTKK